MSHTTIFQRTIALGAVLTLLAGCVSVPQGAGAGAESTPTTARAEEDPCSAGTTALAGAALGALIGAALNGRNGAIAGAALGGAAGYAGCLAYNVQTKQTRTAMQVEQDYRRTNRGRLPATPRVVNYTAQVDSAKIQRGQPFKIASVVEVVNGQKQPVQSVREELVLYTPDGQQINQDPKSKQFQATSGGRYENSFELNLPKGVSQGVYPVKTQLYVNEVLVAKRDLSARVVLVDDMPQIIQLAQR